MTAQPTTIDEPAPRGRRPRAEADGQDGFFFEGVESPNGTIFPDVLIDRVMPHLSGAEFKVLAYIVRRTFGFKKESDAISLDQICNGITRRDGSVLDEGTGLARKTAVAAIQGLEAKGVILCRRRSSPEKGNLPTTFALRFRGQGVTTPGTNAHQGGSEMEPGGGEPHHQPGSLPLPAPGTALHPQSTVVQPTVLQEDDDTTDQPEEVDDARRRSTRHNAGATTEQRIDALWDDVLARLAAKVGAVSHRAWLAPTRLRALADGVATVEVPQPLALRWIERHLRDAIRAELSAAAGRPLDLRLIVAGAGDDVAPASEHVPAPPVRPAPPARPASSAFQRNGGVLRRVRGGAR